MGQVINQTGGSVLGVTNLNNNFYVSGFPYGGCTVNSVTYTTQLECAWWTAVAYATANIAQVELHLGYGYYPINAPLVEPTANFTGVSLIGTGQQGSVILANATMTDAMIYKNETVSGGTWPQLTFRGFKMEGQLEVQGCMRIWGVQNLVVEHLACGDVPNGAPFAYQFGEPNNYAQGWTFQVIGDDVGFANGGIANPVSTRAQITINTSGGAITWPATIVSGGSGYGSASAAQSYIGYIVGNRNGTADTPCATMPTAINVTVSGGAVSNFTGTGGSGCSGTITAMVLPTPNIATAFDIWSTDSTFKDLVPGGGLVGITSHSGNVIFYHAHPTQVGIGIVNSNAGTGVSGYTVYDATELDTVAKWGFDFQNSSSAASVVVNGTTTFNEYPPFNAFHLGSSASVQFGPQANLCGTTQGGTVDYHEFLFPAGTYETQGYLPTGSSIAPNDTVCSNLGAVLQQPLTLPAIAPASSGTHTYSSNPFTMSSSAWISSAVANHKWVWQANENTAGTYHSLVVTPPDPLNSEMDLGGNVLVQPTGTATASANFNSPQLGTNASWWNGTANQSTTFGLSLAPASGTNPAEVGTLGFNNCSSGGCTLQLPPLSAPVTAPGFFPQSGAAGPYSTFFDDFYTGANMASDPIGSPTASSCSPSDTYTDNNHPGNMLLTAGTGGTGTGIVCGLVSENPSITSANTSQGWTWETAVYVPVLPATTTGAYQAGMAHTPNANPWTTGIGFYLSSANGVANDWYCRYNSTSTDSGVAATVAWTRLTMVNDGTNVHWYIGGTQVCGTGVAIANMPSTTQYPAVWSATALSATSVSMAYDYINWQRAVSR